MDRAGGPVPLPDAEAGASARAGAPAPHRFAGDIWLSHGDARSCRCANGKSIVSLMLLGATPGAEITIETQGHTAIRRRALNRRCGRVQHGGEDAGATGGYFAGAGTTFQPST